MGGSADAQRLCRCSLPAKSPAETDCGAGPWCRDIRLCSCGHRPDARRSCGLTCGAIRTAQPSDPPRNTPQRPCQTRRPARRHRLAGHACARCRAAGHRPSGTARRRLRPTPGGDRHPAGQPCGADWSGQTSLHRPARRSLARQQRRGARHAAGLGPCAQIPCDAVTDVHLAAVGDPPPGRGRRAAVAGTAGPADGSGRTRPRTGAGRTGRPHPQQGTFQALV